MTEPVFKNPAGKLIAWAGLLAAGFLLAAACSVALSRHVEQMRFDHPWTYLKEAERLEAENNWVGALAMLKEAARRDPVSPEPHERAGLLHYNHQQWEQALEAYRAALDRGSREADVRGKIVWCLIHLGNYAGAAEFGEACIREGYRFPNMHRYVAEAYRRAGNDQASIPHFEKALEGFPNDLYLMERIVQAYRKTDKPQKADAMQRRIQRLMEQ